MKIGIASSNGAHVGVVVETGSGVDGRVSVFAGADVRDASFSVVMVVVDGKGLFLG